jgi:hypothetical protein
MSVDTIIREVILSNIFELIPNAGNKLEKEFLLEYCQVMNIQHQNPHQQILREMQRFYSSFGYLPEDLDTLSRHIIETCQCNRIPISEIVNASKVLSGLIRKENRVPNCGYVGVHLEFYKQEGRIADYSELMEYISNIERIESDPERYHQENKMRVPTPNLENLLPEKCCKEDNCGLCMEPILVDNECYKLPCNHLFHSNEEECIGVTVKKWLSENKCCPICKQEVNLTN